MEDILILADSRQQKDDYITKYFDKNSIPWVRTGLPSADYMAIRYDNGFIKDYSVLIDTKNGVEEIAHNLCNTTEHERIKREIARARELGCKVFAFLICDSKIRTIDDLKNWSSNRTKVSGATLLKIMKTMSERYGVRFIFTSKQKAGAIIIKLLNSDLQKK